ncbi:hypothetical protein LEP1GSC059_4646 [Leptospira noguchii serovar Panama str. CZ214]|uniref:Uncharacterized protein n=1 Tax=Leptospira noguchii serovar Panama str. CZ214 TaxID=1001595 RepID=T0FKI1_9LEPT|nr:hypothetical protein LEP1GSC059_4646 [Leptospira noguchii serovar Panama str. CZ214]
MFLDYGGSVKNELNVFFGSLGYDFLFFWGTKIMNTNERVNFL